MGYTDLGAFGGHDIPTPNLDSLAMQGIRLTNFHASISCAPTRSMLMSGTGNHEAGLGTQRASAFDGLPGYERHISNRVLTLPERLQSAGYHTFMTGKWHLGKEAGVNLPGDRGFEQSFAQIPGGFDHFKLKEGDELPSVGNTLRVPYTEDGALIDELPDDYYSTNMFVEKMLGYLQESAEDDRPFFAWFAPTAPHWPLQVHPDWIGKMRGQYDEGYDALCFARQQAAQEMGILPEGADLTICPEIATPWGELSEQDKAINSRVMELYAEMVIHLDHEFGRILNYLKESGQLANTYIIYHNDNGPEATEIFDNRSKLSRFNNALDNLGQRDSWVNVGQGWADAQSAPFRNNKGSQFEGGTRVPAFITPPDSTTSGRMSESLLTVMDIAPTVLDLAGVEEVSTGTILPMRGKTFAKVLDDTSHIVHDANEPIALDMAGDSVLIMGDWKIVRPNNTTQWGLFNVAIDPSETTDLALDEPSKLDQLITLYEEHADNIGIQR
ncbi:UNVERIFIED_CONTAM: hypothetical protein GTU68_007632 [Idotea baltica]|nr:hypothetical protein [Idotea baltica]